MLCEEASMRSTSRVADVSINTVAKSLVDAGKACAMFHDDTVRDLTMRSFTRLTNAFSKKFKNHVHMVALHTVWHNFVKMHATLRTTPAMSAGVADRLWSMEDVAAIVESAAPKAGKRGMYKTAPQISN
ncbi:hypothetical protein [Methylopila musalis]